MTATQFATRTPRPTRARVLEYAETTETIPPMSDAMAAEIVALLAGAPVEMVRASVDVVFQSSRKITVTQARMVDELAEAFDGGMFTLDTPRCHTLRMIFDVHVATGDNPAQTLTATLEAGQPVIGAVTAVLGGAWSLLSATAHTPQSESGAR